MKQAEKTAPMDLHQLFDWQYIIGGDFAKFCGLLRIYELYNNNIHWSRFLSLFHVQSF